VALIVNSEHVGSTIIITLWTYDLDDNLTDADELPTISIKRGESALAPFVVEETEMTHAALGRYTYHWDTRGLKSGDHMFECHCVVDGIHRHLDQEFPLTSRGCTAVPPA